MSKHNIHNFSSKFWSASKIQQDKPAFNSDEHNRVYQLMEIDIFFYKLMKIQHIAQHKYLHYTRMPLYLVTQHSLPPSNLAWAKIRQLHSSSSFKGSATYYKTNI